MEVIIAIVILATSTITLLGVQSAVTRRATLDNQRIRAILAAREVLAAAELNLEPPAPGTLEGTPESVRDQLLGRTAPNNAPKPQNPQELPLQVTLQISDWALPGFEEAPLYRYELTVAWGDRQGESITINYFVPTSAS